MMVAKVLKKLIKSGVTTNGEVKELINDLLRAVNELVTAQAAAGDTVEPPPTGDTVNPVVTAPSAASITFLNGATGLPHTDSTLLSLLSGASALDDVDGVLSVSNNLNTLADPLVSGQHTITFSAIDASGNVGSSTVSITVSEAGVIDVTAPVVTAPVDTAFEFVNGGTGVAHSELTSLIATATATDDVDGAVSVTSNLNTLPDPLTAGQHTITFTATDAASNTGTDTLVVTISEAAAINSAPTVANRTVTVVANTDLVVDLSVGVNDLDGDTLTYTITGDTANYTPDGGTAGLGVFNAASGSYSLTVTVGDGTVSVPYTLTVTVTEAPAAFVLSDQNLTVEAAQDLVVTIGPLTDTDSIVIVYNITGTSDYTPGPATNQFTFNSVSVGSVPVGIQGSSGGSGVYVTSTINIDVTAAANVPVILSDQSLTSLVGVDKVITLGPLTDTDGDIITYTVTGSSEIRAGAAGNEIIINAAASGTQTLNVSGDDLKGAVATSTITVIVSAIIQIAPENMLNIGWSIMADVTEHIQPIFQSDGLALNITRVIPSGYMESLGDADMLQAVDDATSSEAVIISAHSGDSMDDPAGPPTWYTAAGVLANKVKASGKEIVWYQSWTSKLSSIVNQEKIAVNFANLKAAHGGLVVKSAEAKLHFLERYPKYGDRLNPTGSLPPTLKMNSDNTHGTFALNYMAALLIFRAMTGITANNATFPVPSSHQITPEFLQRLINTVDAVQDDYYPNVTGTTTVEAPVVQDDIVGIVNGGNLTIVLGDVNTSEGALITYEGISTRGSNDFTITGNTMNYSSVIEGTDLINITATTAAGTKTLSLVDVTVSSASALKDFYFDFGRDEYATLASGETRAWDKQISDSGNVMSGIKGMGGTTGTLTGIIDVNGEVTTNLAVSSRRNKGQSGYYPRDEFISPADDDMGIEQLYWNVDGYGLALKFSGEHFVVGGTWKLRIGGSRNGSTSYVSNVDINGVTGTYDSTGPNAPLELIGTVDSNGDLFVEVTGTGASTAYVAGMSLTQLT